jgi:hypothetical protein
MTNLMTAIIGHLLDIRFVNPAIAEIVVTSDGFVLARTEGDTRTNFVGEYSVSALAAGVLETDSRGISRSSVQK